MPRKTASEHDEWCQKQHEKVNGNINKIYTRLGKMETHIASHSVCAEEVRKELKALNRWAQKRNGATTALMWVAGIAGTVFVIGVAVFKITTG